MKPIFPCALLLCTLSLYGCTLSSNVPVTNPAPNLLSSFPIPSNDNIRCAAFAPDGKTIAATHYDGDTGTSRILLHDSKTWKSLRPLAQKDVDNPSFTFSPDGKFIASPGHNSVEIIDVNTGRVLRKLAYRSQENSHADVELTFSPNGHLLAAIEPARSTVLVWDFATGKQLWSKLAAPQEISGLAFSPDSDLLAVAGWGERPDKRLHLWKAKSGRLIRAFKATTYSVDSPLTFSPDGRFIATSGFPPSHRKEQPEISATDSWVHAQQDFVVMLWNPRTGQLQRVLREEPYPSRSSFYIPLGFSPDSKQLIADSGYTVDTHEIATARRLQRINGFLGSMQKVLSPDSKTIFSNTWPSNDGRGVSFWRLKSINH